ncbi:MAG: histidine phosphatase family protein [Burkholderiaceae bacterium]
MIELILIRHGETAWNAEKRVQGHLDIALNTQGLLQAAALGRRLREQSIGAIISSDLKRATQTALAVALPHAMTISTDAGLRERSFGVFEGMLYADLEGSHPAAYRAWKGRVLDARYPPGENPAETLQEFSDRVLGTIDRLARASAHRTLALVTHGGVLECVYRAATGTSLRQPRDFDILNAGINRVQWTPAHMQISHWSDVTHLSCETLDEL